MDASINCKKCELKTRHNRDEKKKLNTCCICGTEVRFKKSDFLVQTLQRWHDGRPEGEAAAGFAAGREAAENKNEMDGHRSVLNFEGKPPGRKSKYTPAMKAEICRRLGEKEKASALAKEFGCKPWTIYSLARQGREFLKGMSAPAERPPVTPTRDVLEAVWGGATAEVRREAAARAIGAEDHRGQSTATPAQIGEALLVIINAFSESLALAKLAAWKGKLRL